LPTITAVAVFLQRHALVSMNAAALSRGLLSAGHLTSIKPDQRQVACV